MAWSGEVSFARVDDSQVAYSVLEVDPTGRTVVMVSGALFPFEALPEEPGVARLLDGLAAIGRLVMFDRRGIGQSDPIVDWDRRLVEQWADDLAAVVEATTTEPPAVFAWDGFGVGRAFAARHPAALRSLILFHPTQFDRTADEFAQKVEEVEGQLLDNVRRESSDANRLAFGSRTDAGFFDWLDRAGRRGASPAVAERIWASSFAQGAFTPPGITAPTLVLHRPANTLTPPEIAAVVASGIPGARVVAVPGTDQYPITDDIDAVLAEVTGELRGAPFLPPPQRRLAAVLFADIVGSTERAARLGDARWRELLDQHDTTVFSIVGRRGGRVVKGTGDGVLATFPSASQALRSATDMHAALAPHDLSLRVGVHVGEVDERGDDVSGIGVHVAARAMALSAAGDTTVTQSTVASLAGSGLEFDSRGAHELRGVPGSWELFRLVD